VLGDVGGCAAVLATHGQALDEAQCHEDHRRRQADLAVVREQADGKGREPHQQHGDQEGVLTAPEVSQASEDDGAEGADGKARGEGHQGQDEPGGLVYAREEMNADEGGEGAVEVEVVPLEDRAS
jgi:hypothetical protein